MKTTLAIRLAPWIATVALFAVWEAAVWILKIPPFFLPPPSLVFKAVVDYWPALYLVDAEGRMVKRKDGRLRPINVEIPLSAVIPDLFEQIRVNGYRRARIWTGRGSAASGMPSLIRRLRS